MSLSAFLKDYLYIPLGGNRRGKTRRYLNLLITMVLGGLWHGASWTFVLWGALHGAMLAMNHAWRAAFGVRQHGVAGRAACWALTFLGVCLAWVLFRADSLATAFEIYRAMIGLNGILPAGEARGSVLDSGVVGAVIVAATICLAFRNANELPDISLSTPSRTARWLMNPASAVLFACLFAACVVRLSAPSPFLYFQF
jgi:alginate O-acetyltransferase complex protein AlgI